MSKEEPKHIDKELDLSNAGRGVWLVKVPKYIANKWEKATGATEVGKLKISKQQGQKAAVSLTLSDAIINLDPDEKIPREHRLDVSVVTKQTLGVFSHMIRKCILPKKYITHTTITKKLNSHIFKYRDFEQF